MSKIRAAIIFGGDSNEYETSLTALTIPLRVLKYVWRFLISNNGISFPPIFHRNPLDRERHAKSRQ